MPPDPFSIEGYANDFRIQLIPNANPNPAARVAPKQLALRTLGIDADFGRPAGLGGKNDAPVCAA
jgi:hypothetical protein